MVCGRVESLVLWGRINERRQHLIQGVSASIPAGGGGRARTSYTERSRTQLHSRCLIRPFLWQEEASCTEKEKKLKVSCKGVAYFVSRAIKKEAPKHPPASLDASLLARLVGLLEVIAGQSDRHGVSCELLSRSTWNSCACEMQLYFSVTQGCGWDSWIRFFLTAKYSIWRRKQKEHPDPVDLYLKYRRSWDMNLRYHPAHQQ
jgi:hypothetical protein